jgi:hypothetical protein
MATTTPNFGWAVPTSTDLVKDGAVAIETLGDAIDASLLDLKGGTTNQVLAKNSNTDMDFKWVSDATGMTNPMTTTGDTIYSSSGSTPARLGIGSTGQVLTVSGGVPSWATPAAGTPTFVGASIYASAQTITKGTYAKISYANEDYDTDAFHSTVTNTTRMTVPTGKGGKYLINAIIQMPSSTDINAIVLFKNGSRFMQDGIAEGWIQTNRNLSSADATGVGGSIVLDAVATDYFEIACYVEASGTATLNNSRFDFVFLGA